ncbi:hypothetical protein [Antrihabitans cavernicola]|uniref:DUF8020 domain-containing protein n=1 Tax=Antrihabitans cavernicola TaxID=2495913 RepID=A0A5A7S9T6_9NOCA|nr:hypothetical protein [Spelaeibacter cavernicola]KAA0021305.1 hypothetical protein FOY51_18820 [Spelaeibacter cavernicola]
MHIRKFAAVAVMAIAAVGITAGTANAQPAELAPPAVAGVDHGIAYKTLLTDAGKAVTTTIDAGTFSLSRDASSVTLADKNGGVVAQIPLTFQVADRQVSAVPTIDPSGQSLTLTPTHVALQDIGSQQWFFGELQRASTGALVGALIGAAIGVIFLGIGFIPGGLIGAGIGLLVAGGQPLIDSGFAYFGGQP